MTTRAARHWAVVLGSACLTVLTACGGSAEREDAAASVTGSPVSWSEYVASLELDDVGPYKLLSAEWREMDNGFRLGVETRYYVETDNVRSVVVQRNLQAQAGPANGMLIEFVVFDHEGLETHREAVGVPVDGDQLPLDGDDDVLFGTAPVPAAVGDSVLASRPCATLTVDFSAESYLDLELTTCRPASN